MLNFTYIKAKKMIHMHPINIPNVFDSNSYLLKNSQERPLPLGVRVCQNKYFKLNIPNVFFFRILRQFLFFLN